MVTFPNAGCHRIRGICKANLRWDKDRAEGFNGAEARLMKI